MGSVHKARAVSATTHYVIIVHGSSTSAAAATIGIDKVSDDAICVVVVSRIGGGDSRVALCGEDTLHASIL